MVEFSIVSVVFFLLVFGVVGFGQAIYRYNTVSNAARNGARWASVRGNSSGQTPATASDVHDYLLTQMNGFSLVDSVSWVPDNRPGSSVQVVVRSPYTITIPRMTSFTVRLRSRGRMVIFR
jgi:Flp pilus assembly protein TadG